jgi:hypothetical protein
MVSFNYVLNIIVGVLLWLSVAGALLTILTFTLFGELRTFPVRLIMYLCACIAAGYSAFFFTSYSFVVQTWFCWPVAMVTHYFFLANFAWCLVIAFNFYQMIVRRNRDAELFEKWYHLGCWISPGIIVVIVAALQLYGRINNAACYIASEIPRFVSFFVPGLLCNAATAILFFFISREIAETFKGAPNSERRDLKSEFRVYLSIFISIGLTWIFGYLLFLMPTQILQQIMLVLFSLSVPLQGVLIFVSYCLRTKPVSKWAGVFAVCFPCCRKWEELSGSTSYSRL